MPEFTRRTSVRIAAGAAAALLLAYFGLAVTARREAGSAPVYSARAAAQKALAEAAANSRNRESAPPSYRTGLSTENVRSEGSVVLVKRGDFEGVAEEPQGMMEMLTDMSGSNKRKRAPVQLTEDSLNTKIMVGGEAGRKSPLGASQVPEPAEGEARRQEGGESSMITAPVDYQLYRSSATWQAFASSHKGRFPRADFSTENMIILVSVSELPSGIFKIIGVRKTPAETVVVYRVDPLAMSAGSDEQEQHFYSAAPVPKLPPVRLEQAP